MKSSNKKVETQYGIYEVHLDEEKCKLSCGKCLNNCEFGYNAKLINGETEV